MWTRSLAACTIFLTACGPAAMAQGTLQQRNCLNQAVDLQFRITDDRDRPVPFMVHVQLQNSSSVPIQERIVRNDGETAFQVTSPGDYRVVVTAEEIQETTSDTVTVNCGDRSKMTFVHVQPKEVSASASGTGRENVGTMTSAGQLRIPPEAHKLFDRGYAAWQSKDYQKSADFFQQAINAYPSYDAAYNNLGVAYMKLDQPDKALVALQTAVKLNDKSADADRNLARLLIHNGDFIGAEELVKKSLMVEPSDPGGLTLFVITEFENREYAAAVQTAQKVHQLAHEGFASCHYVAGEAYERLGQPQNARVQYQLYLQEMPNGPEAGDIRAALARIDDEAANAQ